MTWATVAIGVWPTSWTVADDPLAPTTDWAGPLRVATYSRLGSGLYQVTAATAGLAAAFLFAGASGVIAPLWSVDDGLAREIAIRFYERAMRGEAPAEIMRTERAAFRDAPETTSSTYLAYQFFGHPALRLVPDAG